MPSCPSPPCVQSDLHFMSTDSSSGPERAHSPQHPSQVQTEGFSSSGAGRDIFFAAVHATRMPMVVADPRQPDVPIVFANRAFLEMTGYDGADVLGRNCRFLQGPDTDRATVDEIRAAIVAEQELSTELLNYRKDGSSFWNALFLTPVRNEAGELVYYFSSQLDVSRRRDAETALQQAQKMEALGQLTGGIAHDFNNQLQSIINHVDIARLRLRAPGSPGAEGVDGHLSAIREAARKSGLLTQRLLSFARKQQLQRRVVDLNDLAREVVQQERRVSGQPLQLHPVMAADLWKAHVDPYQVKNALANLLANAREAMPGGGTVTLRTANLRASAEVAVRHGLPGAGCYVTVAVSDEGAGIAPDALPRVMEPFFTTKAHTDGAGLGLSMVYGFAKQSGGAVTIYSEVGSGTTVRLYFPVAATSAPAPAPVPLTPPLQSARVLVVDDRAEIAEMTAMLLNRCGYEAEHVTSAGAALAALDHGERWDVLLTDVIMPGGMNGVQLAREAQRRLPAVKVLLMTGFADSTPDRWGGGHYEILFKPFTLEEVSERVRQVLEQREDQDV